MNEKLIKVFYIAIGSLVSVIPICVIGLDWKIMADTIYRASLANIELNRSINYFSIYIAVIVINFIIIFGIKFISICAFCGIKISKGPSEVSDYIKIFFIYALSGIFLLLYIPKEAITFKFVSCFNFYNGSFVQARVALILIYAIGLLALSLALLFTFFKKNEEKGLCKNVKSILFCLGFIFLLLCLAGICGLNIAMLTKLSITSKDINPKSIKMALFKAEEIEQIKSGRFTKEVNFDERILGPIHDVVFSENKVLRKSVRYSVNEGYATSFYHLKYYRKEIDCDKILSRDIFIDCQKNISKVIFKFEYKDTGYINDNKYPVYNCATLGNKNDCRFNCQILKNYSVYMVQDFSNEVELAWSGFGKCEVVQPTINLDNDLFSNLFGYVDLCSDSSSEKIQKNSILVFLCILFFYFK